MEGAELTEMVELAGAGAVGFSDDGLPIAAPGVMRRALQYQRLAGLQIALHEEDPELSAAGVDARGRGLGGARPRRGPVDLGVDDDRARRRAGAATRTARIHVQHLSARESVAAVEHAKADGIEITCEATPHHLTLTDEAVRSLDSRFKMNPPLRSEADRQALIEALRSGTIDCIATDHAPHSLDEKEVPFEQAAMGVTGLETAFAVALHRPRRCPACSSSRSCVERMTAGAAAVRPRARRGSPRARRRT